MKEAASRLFAQGFLEGFLSTIGLMVSETPTFEIDTVEELSPDAWPDLVSQYSATIDASVKEGGGVSVLMPAADVNAFAAMFNEEEPDMSATTLPDDKLDSYKEIFEPCLGGGVSYFKEKYEQVIELENATVRAFSIDAMEPIVEMLGDSVVMATFSFKSPEPLDSKGALLFSESLESAIPADEEADAGSAGDSGPSMDQAELDEIMSNLDAAAASPSSASAGSGFYPEPQPANIDRVLDIQLTATARLGRVEMPIGDILALGPGSILEVGHMVDEPVELLVNNKLVARGDVVVVDEKFGLRITEIVSAEERIESLRG